jgi:hypothetical protein
MLFEKEAHIEADRVAPWVDEINVLSAKQIVELDMLGKLPVGKRAAVLAGSRFCTSPVGPCVHGHPPIRGVSADGRNKGCTFCKKMYKSKTSKSRDPIVRKTEARKRRTRRQNNLERYRERERIWRQNNPAKVKAKKIRHRTALGEATPGWLTDNQWDEMNEFYKEAQKLTEATGKVHHVDHVVPIQGKRVCGLHVPWNLQVLTATENLSKGNKFKDRDPTPNE